MAKLQNKLHAKFEVIEKEIVPNIIEKLKDCENTLGSLSVFSKDLFERLISSNNQQEFFFGQFSALDHIKNILVLCIFRTEAENLITVKKSVDNESESDSLLMMEARKRLGEVLEYIETLHSLVTMSREESVKIMKFVSSSRLESGGHQEVRQKLLNYEKKLHKFSSIALDLDSYLSMARVPESRYTDDMKNQCKDLNHNIQNQQEDRPIEGGQGDADQDQAEVIGLPEGFKSIGHFPFAVTSQTRRAEQSRLSEVGEEDEDPEKSDSRKNEDSEAESSIPSFSPPHPSDESEADGDRYETEKEGMKEEGGQGQVVRGQSDGEVKEH